MTQRYYSSTAPEMALTGGINSTVTSMTVDTVVGLPSLTPFTLIVDPSTTVEEIVTVTQVNGTTLTVTRGEDGTSGQAHTTGAVVRHGLTARDLREPQQHIDASTGVHGLGAGSSVVGTTDSQTVTNKTISGASNTLSNIAQSSVTDLVTALAGKAAASHAHSAADVTSGTLAVARGGTGAATAGAALTSLGAAAASHAHAAADVTSGTFDAARIPSLSADKITSGTLPVARGGTGATSAADARTTLGAAATSHAHSAADITSGTLAIERGGTARSSLSSTIQNLLAAADQSAAQTAIGVTGGVTPHTHTVSDVTDLPDIGVANLAEANHIPVYNSKAQLTTATPTSGGHAASKSYVDAKTWSASDITSGTLSAGRGGTGTSNAYYAGPYSDAVNVYVRPSGTFGRLGSSARFKTDVVEIEDTPVLDLRPVTFRWIENGALGTGVIAEEAESLGLHDLVWRGDDGQVEGFHYDRLSVHLLAALRDVSARLEVVEAELAALRG